MLSSVRPAVSGTLNYTQRPPMIVTTAKDQNVPLGVRPPLAVDSSMFESEPRSYDTKLFYRLPIGGVCESQVNTISASFQAQGCQHWVKISQTVFSFETERTELPWLLTSSLVACM